MRTIWRTTGTTTTGHIMTEYVCLQCPGSTIFKNAADLVAHFQGEHQITGKIVSSWAGHFTFDNHAMSVYTLFVDGTIEVIGHINVIVRK